MLIEYGTVDKRIDVTDKLKDINIIPASDIERCYNIIKIDPCFGIEKSIFINGKEYKAGKEIDLTIFKTSNSFNKLLIEYGTLHKRIDVTDKLKDINIIPASDIERCYNIIKIDPCFGIEKSIFINGKEYKAGKEIDLTRYRYRYRYKPMIFILIRCCYRPNYFKQCIESIMNQSYKNINLIISYDDENCLEYLNEYKNKLENKLQNLQLIKVEKDISKDCFYNLYCNELLNKVPVNINNWIMFLDDDDKFQNNTALENIISNINSNNDFIFWKFIYNDGRIIGPNNYNELECGIVANSTYLFNSIYKHYSNYELTQGGDFEFIKKFKQNRSLNLNFKYLQESFTGTQNGHNEGKDEKLIHNLTYKVNNIKLLQSYVSNYDNIISELLKNNIKKLPIIISICDNLYPPQGGGQNWLLSMTNIFNDINYFNIIISINNNNIINYDNNLNLINLYYDENILEFIIKYINPLFVNHQGFYRLELMKICNNLKIQFLTGFCFWNDLIHIDSNINMENKIIKKNENLDKIIENSNCYVVSNFMKKIIKKINVTLPVIESININENFVKNTDNKIKNKYVTLLNCNYLKGGQILLYLLKNLDYNIPLCGIITEYDSFYTEKIKEAFIERNKINNINILHNEKLNDIEDIYYKTKIMLIPSIVDETYCRVAYESRLYNIFCIFNNNGNLKNIFNDYKNSFGIEIKYENYNVNNYICKNIEDEFYIWKSKIENIYNELPNYNIKNISYYEENYNIIKNKVETIITNIQNKKKYNICLFGPFYDQGLGIQIREYYNFLMMETNNNVIVFSHKPFNDNIDYITEEWSNYNIFRSKYKRDNIPDEEFIKFIIDFKIDKIFIPEITEDYIFNIIELCKKHNVITYGIINIEMMKIYEIHKLNNLDYILTNNSSSFDILNKIFGCKVKLLEFDNYYFKKYKKIKDNFDEFKFIIFGGLNCIYRKQINIIYNYFSKITNKKFKLYIYVQDINFINYFTDTHNIKIISKNIKYEEILNLIKSSDIIINCGSHEGLGLGFYEALNNNKPLITLNTFPNKEFVIDGENGFLIDVNYEKLKDNNNSLINSGRINAKSLENLFNKISNPDFENKLIDIINRDKWIYNNYKNNFINIIN